MEYFKGEFSIVDCLGYTQDILGMTLKHYTEEDIKAKGKGFFIVGRGDRRKPILCVHLDTINTHSDKIVTQDKLILDTEHNVLSVAENTDLCCLGADDRAGVYIAVHYIEQVKNSLDWKYDIGFFYDEEIGCLGSDEYKKVQYSNINTTCYIGLDRRSADGKNEVATYGLDNSELLAKFTSLGYTHSQGSVTDASNLAGEVACINLSVGYDKEHSTREVLYLNCMEDTLKILNSVPFGTEKYPVTSYCMDTEYYDYMWKDDPEDELETARYYIYELEEENKVLREALEAVGINADELVREELYYA